ncbi:hypothetical protein AB1N83_002094 [Pleurotus pulmonarius]
MRNTKHVHNRPRVGFNVMTWLSIYQSLYALPVGSSPLQPQCLHLSRIHCSTKKSTEAVPKISYQILATSNENYLHFLPDVRHSVISFSTIPRHLQSCVPLMLLAYSSRGDSVHITIFDCHLRLSGYHTACRNLQQFPDALAHFLPPVPLLHPSEAIALYVTQRLLTSHANFSTVTECPLFRMFPRTAQSKSIWVLPVAHGRLPL